MGATLCLIRPIVARFWLTKDRENGIIGRGDRPNVESAELCQGLKQVTAVIQADPVLIVAHALIGVDSSKILRNQVRFMW